MGARYYDPTLGRFTEPDPSGQERNPYLYAGGDPVNQIDPTGLFKLSASLEDTGAVLAGVAGAIITVSTAPACTTVVGCAAPIAAAGGTLTAAGVAIGKYQEAFE
ncbi:RHS repeat-associated core domain-containing protein [Streptomyces sp. A5-4]|uniref:RHS repeat-associated core domain-containing protein n=1 Tax=Streptomyces sp. A5-4 TaxID=3384771 RepID=UPI003DA8CED3